MLANLTFVKAYAQRACIAAGGPLMLVSPELPVTANVGIKLQIDEEIRVKPQCKFNAMLGEGLAIYVVFGFNCDLSRYALNCSKFIPLMSLEILVLISLKILTVSNSFTILFFVFIIHNFFW